MEKIIGKFLKCLRFPILIQVKDPVLLSQTEFPSLLCNSIFLENLSIDYSIPRISPTEIEKLKSQFLISKKEGRRLISFLLNSYWSKLKSEVNYQNLIGIILTLTSNNIIHQKKENFVKEILKIY